MKLGFLGHGFVSVLKYGVCIKKTKYLETNFFLKFANIQVTMEKNDSVGFY